MNIPNKLVLRTFTSSHSNNAWGYIQDIGWRKVKPISTDGVTNMFMILCAARANNLTVSGYIEDATNQIVHLYL